MNLNIIEMGMGIQTDKWQEPELILLTRKEPEKTAKTCCAANFSLTDSGCSGPLHDH